MNNLSTRLAITSISGLVGWMILDAVENVYGPTAFIDFLLIVVMVATFGGFIWVAQRLYRSLNTGLRTLFQISAAIIFMAVWFWISAILVLLFRASVLS